MNRPEMPRAAGDGTVGKALAIMDMVAEQRRPVRFAELLALSGHPKATLHRLLQTLTNQGMLRHDPVAQTYVPGLRVVRLAHAAWAQSSLGPIARPHVQDLANRLGETVHLAQLDAGQVLYVDKCQSGRTVPMFSEAGKVGPAYCTGIGKAMLAFLPERAQAEAVERQAFHRYTPATITDPAALREELHQIRAAGVALDREEHEPGIVCAAVPILAPDGHLVGGLSVSTSTHHGHREAEALLVHRAALDDTARRIAEAAVPWQFPVRDQGEDDP